MPAKQSDEFFQNDVVEAIQQSIVKQIKDMRFVGYPGRNLEISHEVLEKAFARIDQEKIIALLTEDIEVRLAAQIFNSLQTEITNDIKTALSNKALRHGCLMAASIAIRDFVNKATENS